jgi:hypothetical protein
MSKKSLFVAALVAAAAVAGLRCKRTNGAYCDDARPCPSGFACNLTARECHALSGGGDMAGSTDMAGCTCSGVTPLCVAMTCVSCLSSSDPEGACAAAAPSTPHCLTTDPGSGACVACRDGGDCSGATPFCDATTKTCRGCLADSECPSLICELTPGAISHGLCVPMSQVVYADPNGNDGPTFGLTPTMPNKTIQHAINNAVGLNPARGFVHAATGTYPEGGTGVNGKTIYIVGADGATIHATMNGKDGLGASGGGSMTIRNMTIIADMGNGGNCNGASYTAYHSKFINSGQTGFVSMNCTPLLLDGCIISGNKAGGVVVQSGDFTIINSALVANSGGAGMYQTGAGTNTFFVNNTVADNTVGGGPGGIHCAAPGGPLPVNTILYNNKSAGGILSETDCTGSFLATDDATAGPQSTVDLTAQAPGFVGGGDYHLVAGSPCLDRGSSTVGPPPNHDADFLPRPDAKTKKIDLGAYELQQ